MDTAPADMPNRCMARKLLIMDERPCGLLQYCIRVARAFGPRLVPQIRRGAGFVIILHMSHHPIVISAVYASLFSPVFVLFTGTLPEVLHRLFDWVKQFQVRPAAAIAHLPSRTNTGEQINYVYHQLHDLAYFESALLTKIWSFCMVYLIFLGQPSLASTGLGTQP